MGGLSKKATQIKERRESKASTLLVDAGALLFPQPVMGTGLQLEQARITAGGITEIYREMDYDAVGIAERDLAAGSDFLLALSRQSGFPWLSANLVRAKDGSPLFTPWTVVKKGKINIGLTALTRPDSENNSAGDKETRILSWQESLPAVLTELRKQSDMIILFSNLEEAQNLQISSNYPEIHIIIQSGQRISNLHPKLYNNTIITQTAEEGKYLGEMEISWDSSGKWKTSDTPSPLLAKKNELDRLKWQLENMLKKGDPETVYRDRPQMLKRFNYLRDRTDALNSEIARLEEQKEAVDGAEWENTFWQLSSNISDDRTVVTIINKIKDRKADLAQKVQTTRNLPGYSGSANCQRCHGKIFNAWSDTPHAKAWWTLKEKKENYNIKCLPCHVTGLSENEGVRALSLPPKLHNVGCEACHGPGADHAAHPEAENIKKTPGRQTCLGCHRQEHDNSFDFEQDRLLVH